MNWQLVLIQTCYVPDTEEELEDVYQSTDHRPQTTVKVIDNSSHNSSLITHHSRLAFDRCYQVKDLHQCMQHHPNLILMGQDIAEYGGAFKITEGFVKEFGKERVRNTPLCESAIVGTALGFISGRI